MKMKTSLLIVSVLCACNMLVFSQSETKDYSLAKVGKRVAGAYIFMNCEPANEYDFLGTIHIKITWNQSNHEQFERVLKKARSKYPTFNGVIIRHYGNMEAELIKFKGLEFSGGGYRLGEKVSFKYGSKVITGEISFLDNAKQKATIMYLDEYGETKYKDSKYNNLSPVNDEIYSSTLSNQKAEADKHKFVIGEKVSWLKNNISYFGTVTGKDPKLHKAVVEYYDVFHDKKTHKIDYLLINKMSSKEYATRFAAHAKDEEKYKFAIGEKVKFKSVSFSGDGTITLLNDNLHKASISYLNSAGNERTVSVRYQNIFKQE